MRRGAAHIILSLALLTGLVPGSLINDSAEAITTVKEGPSDFLYGGMENLSRSADGLTLMNDANVTTGWKLVANDGPKPDARRMFSMVYDDVRNQSILFGGVIGEKHWSDDIWTYNASANTWSKMTPPVKPSRRLVYCMVYDTVRDAVILYGGVNENFSELGDTWWYDIKLGSWINKNPPGSPGNGVCMAYHRAANRVVLYSAGNWGTSSTWIYDPENNTWSNPKPPGMPPSRVVSVMAYDESLQDIVMFGGSNTNAEWLNDTWVYEIKSNKWIEKTPAFSPSPRRSGGMVYNDVNREIFMFGGNPFGPAFNETWAYNSTKNTWRQLRPPASPPANSFFACSYDRPARKMIVFGGEPSNGPDDALWTWGWDHEACLSEGTYTSQPHDMRAPVYFGRLGWQSSGPDQTWLKFQFRSADTAEKLAGSMFLGPDGTNNTYYVRNGTGINPVHNGSRWFQLRAFMGTSDPHQGPLLQEIRVETDHKHRLSITFPAGGETLSRVKDITWTVEDPDADPMSFDITLEGDTGVYYLAQGISGWSWRWNTYLVPNGTYQLRIVANDIDGIIPLSDENRTGWFYIKHVKMDQPPWAEMLLPNNDSIINTTYVNLSWNGGDPDLDPVSYYVFFDDSSGATVLNLTKRTNFTVADLVPGHRYFWTIVPTDGMFEGIPLPVRSFEVDLNKTNTPPSITGKAPSSALVGRPFLYKVTVNDPDRGDISQFRLADSPTGMTINSTTGQIEWTPEADQTGNQPVRIIVSDGFDQTEQSFSIKVTAKQDQPSRFIPGPGPFAVLAALLLALLVLRRLPSGPS